MFYRLVHRRSIFLQYFNVKLRLKIDTINKEIMIAGHMPFLQKPGLVLLKNEQPDQTLLIKNSAAVCLNRDSDKRWRFVKNISFED